jgi:acetoacetyl-CoA synthetase
MPLFLWGDADGSRYRESYFEMFPGIWRHGDWIKITSRGSAVIYGRSDSTINRGGVRMGTSEIYSAVEGTPEVLDSLVVDVDEQMLLFVVLREGVELDDELRATIRRRVREDCSPRHMPDSIEAIAEVPRTLSNKKLEVPVKKILLGADPGSAASRDSLANPAALDWFAERAAGISAR